MIDALTEHREAIARSLASMIDNAAGHLDRVGTWGSDFRRRLRVFALGGKLIRGSLVAAGAQAFGYKPDANVYQIAAAVELIQSFLLIHDDIMDEDALRRGEPSVFEQYRQFGADSGYTNAARFGESMGICAGDVAMLLAFEGVASTALDPGLRMEIVRRLAAEIADVAVAQMADVANGHTCGQVTEEEILLVYRHKTGRYTFSLPLGLGALVANAPADDIEALGRWGELQGIIFQIRDDRLGLMEETETTGKPSGSDVTTNKQTLHRLKLFAAAPGTPWEPVLSYFGNPVSSDQLRQVRSALSDLGILAKIDLRVGQLRQESDAVVGQLRSISGSAKSMLRDIADFNLERRR